MLELFLSLAVKAAAALYGAAKVVVVLLAALIAAIAQEFFFEDITLFDYAGTEWVCEEYPFTLTVYQNGTAVVHTQNSSGEQIELVYEEKWSYSNDCALSRRTENNSTRTLAWGEYRIDDELQTLELELEGTDGRAAVLHLRCVRGFEKPRPQLTDFGSSVIRKAVTCAAALCIAAALALLWCRPKKNRA
ncbi:MAG: hypothetical protein IJP01_02345 [Oscillospiraceae bacterium]|nr:hypothetical protein [Oscillospiraceae bacterium]